MGTGKTISWHVWQSQYIGDLKKREILQGRAWWHVFGMALLSLSGLWGIQSQISSEEFYHSQFGGAYIVNWPDLFSKQVSLELTMFGGDEVNFRQKSIFQQILNHILANWYIPFYQLSLRPVVPSSGRFLLLHKCGVNWVKLRVWKLLTS